MEYHMETRELSPEEGAQLRRVRNSLIITAILLGILARSTWFLTISKPLLLTANAILIGFLIYCIYKIWEYSVDLYFGTKQVIKGLVVAKFGAGNAEKQSFFYKIGSKSFRPSVKQGGADIGDMVEIEITRHSEFMFSFKKV